MDEREEYLKLTEKGPRRLRKKLREMIETAERVIGPLPRDFTEAMIQHTARAEAIPRQSEVEMAAIFYRDGWRAARDKIEEY